MTAPNKKALLLAAMALCLIGGIFWGVNFYLQGGDAQMQIDAYRRAGLPWTADDMRVGSPVKQEENAAPLVKEAVAALPKIGKTGLYQFPEAETLLREGRLDDLADLFKPFEKSLALAEEAATRPRLDLHRNWDFGALTSNDDLDNLRLFVKWLSLRAQVRAGKGDSKGMVSDLLTAWRLSKLIGQEPSWHAYQAAVLCEENTLSSLLACGKALRGSEADLKTLDAELKTDTPPDLLAALKGVAYEGLATVRNHQVLDVKAGVKEEFKGRLETRGIPTNPIERVQAIQYLQAWTAMSVDIAKYAKDPLALGPALDKTVELHKLNTIHNKKQGYRLPIFTRVCDQALAREARVLVTRAYLHAFLYEIAHGKLPEHITDLAGSWKDPYRSNPVKLASLQDILVVYSFGKNKRDDDGLVYVNNRRTRRCDDIAAGYPPERAGL